LDDLAAEWKSELSNDPVLRGNLENTSLAIANTVVEKFPTHALFQQIRHKRDGSRRRVRYRLMNDIGRALNISSDEREPPPSTRKK
jgi:hypothetical protein